jgi:uncharacterized protein (TIGR03086 family)
MDTLAAHQRAQEVFGRVLADVTVEQFDLSTPCEGWTVRQLIDHMVAGNQLVQSRAGREPVPLPDDLLAAHATSAAAAHAVFAAPDGLTRRFELPIGTVSGDDFIGIRTGDAFTHAWDLARSTAQPTDLDPELAEHVLAFSRRRITPELRGRGRPFGEEQPCPPGASPADRVASYLGRSIT